MKEEILLTLIAELIDTGEMLVDGAETCSHYEEVEEWRKIKKKAKKVFPKGFISALRKEQEKKEIEKEKKKIEEALKLEDKKMKLLEDDPDLGDFFKSLKK
jgi:hypothetical protein